MGEPSLPDIGGTVGGLEMGGEFVASRITETAIPVVEPVMTYPDAERRGIKP